MKRYKFTKHDRQVLAQALDKKGVLQQLAKAAEELQELGQVLTKILGDTLAGGAPAHAWDAVINHRLAREKVHEELADVELLLHQVRRIFGPARPRHYQRKINGLADELQTDYQATSRMHRQDNPIRPRVHIMGPFGTDDLKGVLESKSDILDAMRYATSLLDPVLEVGPKAASVWTDAIKKYYQEKEKTAAPSYIEQLLADHSASYLEEFKKKHGGKDREPLGVPFTSADTVAAQLDKTNKDFFNIWADREKAKSTAPKYVPVPAHRLRLGDVVKIKKGLEFTAKLDKVEPAYDCIQGRIMRLYYTMQGGMPAKGNVIKARHHTVDVLAFKDHADPEQVLQDMGTETTDMLVPAKRLQIGDVVQLPNQPTPVTLTFVEVRQEEVGLYFASGQYWAAPLRKIHALELHEPEEEALAPEQRRQVHTIEVPAERLRTGDQIMLHGEKETVDSCTVQPPEEEDLGQALTKFRQEVHLSFTSGHSVVLRVGDTVDLVMAATEMQDQPAPEDPVLPTRHLAPYELQVGQIFAQVTDDPTTPRQMLLNPPEQIVGTTGWRLYFMRELLVDQIVLQDDQLVTVVDTVQLEEVLTRQLQIGDVIKLPYGIGNNAPGSLVQLLDVWDRDNTVQGGPLVKVWNKGAGGVVQGRLVPFKTQRVKKAGQQAAAEPPAIAPVETATKGAPGFLQSGMVIQHPRSGEAILVTRPATRNGQNFAIDHLTMAADRFNILEVGGITQLQVLQLAIETETVPAHALAAGNIIRHPHTDELVVVTDMRSAGGRELTPEMAVIVSHRAAGMVICEADRSFRIDSTATVQRVTGWPF